MAGGPEMGDHYAALVVCLGHDDRSGPTRMMGTPPLLSYFKPVVSPAASAERLGSSKYLVVPLRNQTSIINLSPVVEVHVHVPGEGAAVARGRE